MQANMNCSRVVTIMMLPIVLMATNTHCTTCCKTQRDTRPLLNQQALQVSTFKATWLLSRLPQHFSPLSKRLPTEGEASSSNREGHPVPERLIMKPTPGGYCNSLWSAVSELVTHWGITKEHRALSAEQLVAKITRFHSNEAGIELRGTTY